MDFPNLGYLFYKHCYVKFTQDDWNEILTGGTRLTEEALSNLSSINNQIKSVKFDSRLADFFNISLQDVKCFCLTTTYPGLLLGAGYGHGVGNVKDEYKLGFYFDYTTGLPVIPGSSIKGVIRSAFSHTDYICECLRKVKQSSSKIDIKKLESEIFEAGDIFFDAYIISATDSGKILGDDYITPHRKFKNPVPLKFLKVLPGVTFKFQFKLKDGLLSADEKKELFKNIIVDLGIGAKTNVGYGKLI